MKKVTERMLAVGNESDKLNMEMAVMESLIAAVPEGEGHEVPAGELMTMNNAGEFVCVKCADEIKAQTKNDLQKESEVAQ